MGAISNLKSIINILDLENSFIAKAEAKTLIHPF